MVFNKRIRTVLYDDQRFSTVELELLHTPAFQRLYDLHQLGLTDRVFIDASHSRLHHVIGVVEQATKLMESLSRNLAAKPAIRLEYTEGPRTPLPTARQFAAVVKTRIPAARLMALLHDLTHAPYGHTLEDEIRLVEEKHDEPKRQADAFYRVALQFVGWLWRNSTSTSSQVDIEEGLRHLESYLDWPDLIEPRTDKTFINAVATTCAELIRSADERKTLQPSWKLSRSELTQFLKELAFAMRAMLFLDAAHKQAIEAKHVPLAKYPFDDLFDNILVQLGVVLTLEDRFVPHRDAFMLDVIGNTICADLLDYAKRDSVNAGLKLDYDANRIVENFTLISYDQAGAVVSQSADSPEIVHPFRHTSIRTAISLFGHKLRTDVPGELLNLLQVRYYVYERMLFHPTKCIAGAMLGAAVQLIGWKHLPLHFRCTGDAVFLHCIRDAGKVAVGLLESLDGEGDHYDFKTCAELQRRLTKVPATGITKTVIELLQDRVVLISDLKLKLVELLVLQPFRDVGAKVLEAVRAIACNDGDALDARLQSKIIEKLRPDPEFKKCAELLSALSPTVGRIKHEIIRGLDLMNRLMARQFHKAVFRVSQNVKVLKTKNITPTLVADRFKNSTTRFITEREIERRCGLSPGSIVIHCPNAHGPTKIAEILITPGTNHQGDGPSEAVPLHKIGSLHSPTFEEHEKAINALQDIQDLLGAKVR